ncbi:MULTISPECIES: SidA/IucD/PvdA family monooxygenase [unclassified Variovorax]|uniref:lysine N(6)-hydroxylase/L-ornithine N(5)-oxygenase family protein n=1 Tax=unclassified Variovorax TaxID=663243 RepID=UPI00076D6ECD|nr:MULTISPECIES: SidA/IucD/PvdA family monooxygenase [unclassified Variovorax]KWT72598.1 L-lysine 6-monooxygenase [NADPH], aerobactin biosynthesis protein IucD [Variovorax sp. WDL1]PNG58417.1 L-lysine N6-monooxygenase [Variovorax sp. B4]PNG61793.1 L-lysine N6-monooxygenase [Variovorax sp. B2]VTV12147.1 L-lysine N6-monooxygenase [Variovorax sp. WDL1]
MSQVFDLVGLGLGPFNLSVAALATGLRSLSTLFLEKNPRFQWHEELMFPEADMQTTYLKDLVTPVDPTNPHSFLNYLVAHGRFYSFLNTNRQVITRREFQHYCRWVSEQLHNAVFGSEVRDVAFHRGLFQIRYGNDRVASARSLCIGTGHVPYIPPGAKDALGPDCFHAKSPELRRLDLRDKRVVVIGGGQTGAEIFKHAIDSYWGPCRSLTLVSRRMTLEALDDSAFVNDYFTPSYTRNFFGLDPTVKSSVIERQKLAGDGITSAYLQQLYKALYLRTIEGNPMKAELLCGRELTHLQRLGSEFRIDLGNKLRSTAEEIRADVVILATGFRSMLPRCLGALESSMQLDDGQRIQISENYRVAWSHDPAARIYAVNFGRHSHGIAEPQISLMAWRSARILNDLLEEEHFRGVRAEPAFIHH